jgi:hypothetical protein
MLTFRRGNSWTFRQKSLSRRPVERRLSRRLAAKGLVLRKCSPKSRWHFSLGDYYLTRDTDRFLVAAHQDLEDLAREYAVISEGQAIADE